MTDTIRFPLNGKFYVSEPARHDANGETTCIGCVFSRTEGLHRHEGCIRAPLCAGLIFKEDHFGLASADLAKDTKPTNPKDAAATGRVPLHMVPDTLTLYAAIAMAEGDSKYVSYNYRIAGVRASVYISALRRHLMKYVNGEWADPKTQVPHLASVAACTAILIDGHVCETIVDDRPPSVDLTSEFERAEEIISHVYALNKDKRPVGVEYTRNTPVELL